MASFIDTVKERAKYETGNKYGGRPENKRAKHDWTYVPSFVANAGLMWYPTEFIQVYAGYEVDVFLHTLASRRPIDFDYSNLAPKWSHFDRVFNGFTANIAITF